MSTPKSLNQKIVAIMKDAQAIGKNGSNTHYDYVQAVDVIREMKRHLVAHSIRLKTEDLSFERAQLGKQVIVTLRIRYTLIDRETGETETTELYAEGADMGDKAINKARTNGLKYYFRDLFLLDFADDAEAVNNQPQPQQEQSAPAKKSSRSASNVWDGLQPQKQPTAKAVAAKANDSLKQVERQRKRFFAICGKKKIADKWQKVVILFYTGKSSRKDVTDDEYRQINNDLQHITGERLKAMADSIKAKGVSA